MGVTGTTDINDQIVFGIIGDPIKQVKSPAAFGEYFLLHGINAVMVPLHVGTDNFERVLKGLRGVKNFGGAVITIPYKYEAYNMAFKSGPMALATGTANVLVPLGKNQWSAEMLDGVGLICALRRRSIETTGLRTLIVGAGGAGTAIAMALQQLGQVAFIGISDTDIRRAETLVAKLKNADIVASDPQNFQLVVNASPVGMGSDEIPLEASRCSPGTIVCDAIMHPPKTRLLQEAEQNRCIIVEGLEMLHGQVEPIVRFMGLDGSYING
jgi:shikimate dehydrogenase